MSPLDRRPEGWKDARLNWKHPMFINLTLHGEAATAIFINVNHIISFARKAGVSFTEVHCSSMGGDYTTNYLVTETVEEIIDLIEAEGD
ncbi:hypothetical protein SLT36_30300 (plasmid) [Aminobacter sp. BA135]|uniref:hypothetical protein n=1 Tax=Aminobacter sp. BA135 TaxID=537596 RepID=UPI003D7AA7BC